MTARETYTKIERLLRDEDRATQERCVDLLRATLPHQIPVYRKALLLFDKCPAEEQLRVVSGLRTLLLGETVE